MVAYRSIYPTIEFSNVNFFTGIPGPFDRGQSGFTLPAPFGGINVYLKPENYDPCGQQEETFLLIAHELVHALQIQDATGLGLFSSFVTGYISCFLTTGFSSARDNPYEREAYDFANGGGPATPTYPTGKLRACVDAPPALLPCDCAAIPWLTPTPNFVDQLLHKCPDIVKREAETGVGACLSEQGGPLGTGIGGIIGGIIGGLIGGPAGIVIGFGLGLLLGFFWGFTSLGLGFIAGFLGEIFGAIGSLIGSIIDAVSDFFSGDGVGGISLMFSTDRGLTFGNKVTLESSSEPPALTTDGNRLYLGWTGTDNRLNVFAAPNSPPKATFEESNDDAGPALVFAFAQARILWQDGDNHLHLMSSPAPAPNLNFGGKLNLGQNLAGSASPALALGQDAFGNDLIYFAWIDDDDNKVYIGWSPDGVNWANRVFVNESSTGDGTPAIAFGNGRLYLAWVDDDDNNLHVKSFLPAPSLQVTSNTRLGEISSDDAGPALAFENGRLFLAWTDDNQRLQVMLSDDPSAQVWQSKQQLGHSSDNAGPALTFIPRGLGGILCVAWIDK